MNEMESLLWSYNKLNTSHKEQFRRVTNKLFSNCFMTKHKEDDRKDYYFIDNNRNLFRDYFQLSGWELDIDDAYGVMQLINTFDQNRVHFKIYESIVLLILRLLYDEQARELTLSDEVVITIDAIHDKFKILQIRDKPINKTTLTSTLRLFKRYSIINMIDNDYTKGDSRLILYPTILLAVKIKDIDEILKKLESYKTKGADEDVETDEDSID